MRFLLLTLVTILGAALVIGGMAVIGVAVLTGAFAYGLQSVMWGIVGGVILIVVGVVILIVAARSV